MKTALFFLIVLTSCGPSYHLRRAAYHKRMAIAKGAEIKKDTVWWERAVIIKGDTVTKTLPGSNTIILDTVFLQGPIKIRVKRDTIKESIFVECPPDTVKIRVPVTITETIKAPPSLIDRYWWVLAILIILAFVYANRKK